jgi:hypothetical protein
VTFNAKFGKNVKKINLFFHEQFSLLNWHIFGRSYYPMIYWIVDNYLPTQAIFVMLLMIW